jgi:hypothetical protein
MMIIIFWEMIIIIVTAVETSNLTHVSTTLPSRLMLFIMRTIRNTQMHSVGKMQNLYIETGGTLDIKGLIL